VAVFLTIQNHVWEVIVKKVAVLFFVLSSSLVVFPASGFAENHQREGWYIGAGLGLAPNAQYSVKDGATIQFDDAFTGPYDSKSPKLALNFKIGKTLSDKSLLGLDVTAVGQTATYPGNTAQVQINNYFLMYTYFPEGEGLFFRIGGGLSSLVVLSPAATNQYGGVGALVGAGYAFWLGKTFNLTVNADYSAQQYSQSAGSPSTSNYLATYLGFDWY
jgi:hypothetical protein